MLLIIMSINSSFINQENPIEKIKKAIEITSPREIINLLHDDFELNIENEIINSNKNKAELILKISLQTTFNIFKFHSRGRSL